MISADYVRTLLDYSTWATERVLAAAEQLTPEVLTATPLAGHASLLGTLVHTLAAEVVWRARWEGSSPTTMLSTAEIPTLAALRSRWAIERTALHARLAMLTDAELLEQLHYRTTSGQPFATPLWQVLVQIVNHGTQHRSEAAAMLTILGRSPGNLDVIIFFRERADAT